MVTINTGTNLRGSSGKAKYDDLEQKLASGPVITVPSIERIGLKSTVENPHCSPVSEKSERFHHNSRLGGLGSVDSAFGVYGSRMEFAPMSAKSHSCELDGLCESPHDDPARWALVLTACFDESMESGDGNVVVAGFMGKRSAWEKCRKKWRSVLEKHGRKSLHMKELRFKGDRHREMLRELGEIPERCGLWLIFASVNVAAYKPLVEGTELEVASEGYLYAFQIAVLAALYRVPEGQRLEVICEHQLVFSQRRENICIGCTHMTEHQNKNRKSKLAKWSSISKSTILEPADYAAFALLQKLRDKQSLKARLCAPILKNKLKRGLCLSDVRSREILSELMREDASFSRPILTTEAKKAFIRQIPTGADFERELKHPSRVEQTSHGGFRLLI